MVRYDDKKYEISFEHPASYSILYKRGLPKGEWNKYDEIWICPFQKKKSKEQIDIDNCTFIQPVNKKMSLIFREEECYKKTAECWTWRCGKIEECAEPIRSEKGHWEGLEFVQMGKEDFFTRVFSFETVIPRNQRTILVYSSFKPSDYEMPIPE
jgi:hypothetical protein